MKMSLHQQRDIVDAAMQRKTIEVFKPTIEAPLGEWVPIRTCPVFDFEHFEYRVKPPALRPHWPAVVRNTGTTAWWVTDELFADVATARIELLSDSDEVRLATEYPPVMLP